MAEPLVVFVTALELEAAAVMQRFDADNGLERSLSGILVRRGIVVVDDSTIDVALLIAGQGNLKTGAAIAQLFNDWPLACFFFVGVAAGRREEVAIGDVVLADRVYSPLAGKQTAEGFRPRSATPALTKDLEHLVRHVVANDAWASEGPGWEGRRPTAHVRPIASSDVIDGVGQGVLEFVVEQHFDDAYAVETEGYGFMAELAARSGRGVLVRGISDLRAGKTARQDAAAQPVAAAIAMTLALEIVREGVRSGVIARPALSAAAKRLVDIVRAAGVPVPVAQIANRLAPSGSTGETIIDEAARNGELQLSNLQSLLVATADEDDTPCSAADLHIAVEELLAQITDTAPARAYLAPAVELARRLLVLDPVRVLHFFDRVEKAAKRTGSLRLVLDAARISMQASVQRRTRTREEIETEAKALICGVSWVFQRIGRLDEGLAEGRRSLELGEQINWHRNTYYCEKCLGRIMRLQAESTNPLAERHQTLERSVSSLERAIIGFEQLEGFGPGDPEVGDCHSLLGRTYLVMGDRVRAREHAEIASTLLTDSQHKDAMDLAILIAELDALDGSLDSAFLRLKPIIELATDSLEQSEIVARALVAAARVLARQGMASDARSLLVRALHIAEREDLQLLAAAIRWELEESKPTLPSDLRQALRQETPRVRMAGIAIHSENQAAHRRSVAARRPAGVEAAYRDRLLRSARQRAAAEDLRW